ncbi:MAG: hypothetical protein V1767_02500 [Chloroflexota bacterium]
MLKRIGLLVILAILLVTGCRPQPGEITAKLGEEFNLALGQRASIQGEPFQIRFVEVIGDSRCPEGAICIWAGEASCKTEITYGETILQKILVQPGSSGNSTTDFQDYKIAFDVKPYPEVGKEIRNEEYRLVLIITKHQETILRQAQNK